MPLPNFRIEIKKRWGNNTWNNSYLVNAADLANAIADADALVQMEKQFHYNFVTIASYRVSTIAEGDRIFRHGAPNVQGNVVMGQTTTLPLFNTVRVDLATAESDPARKYYRLPLNEEHNDGGVFNPATASAIANFISTTLFSSTNPIILVTNKGHAVTSVSVHPYVQMRQTRRKWARRNTTGGGGEQYQ